MGKASFVDTSYRERRHIQKLLDFLTKEHLTKNQIERIGRRLQRSGKRALPPLVRRLWREQNQERLYRYTCMLDFFDAGNWLDQLISLTLQRKDLAEEGRLPLLEILQDYGVDVSQPPFSAEESNSSVSLHHFVATALEEGYWGAVRFMDRILDADEGVRDRLIHELVFAQNQPQAAAYLMMLAGFEYKDVAAPAIEALGRIRHATALEALTSLHMLPVDGLEPVIQRSIKRLRFVGISEPDSLPGDWSRPVQLVSTQVSPIDYNGLRVVWFSWLLENTSLASIVIQLGEQDGVHYAVSSRFATQTEHDEYLDEVHAEEALYQVPVEYAVSLLRGALWQSREKNFYLPPELYASRYLFAQWDITPFEYEPHFSLAMLDGFLDHVSEHITDADQLLENPYFDCWVVGDPAVFDLINVLEGVPIGQCSFEMQQIVLTRFCEEVLEPASSALVKRLLLVADFMVQTAVPLRTIQQVLAVAMSIASGVLPLHKHPFVRQLAFNSLETAALAIQGGNPGLHLTWYDSDDWDD